MLVKQQIYCFRLSHIWNTTDKRQKTRKSGPQLVNLIITLLVWDCANLSVVAISWNSDKQQSYINCELNGISNIMSSVNDVLCPSPKVISAWFHKEYHGITITARNGLWCSAKPLSQRVRYFKSQLLITSMIIIKYCCHVVIIHDLSRSLKKHFLSNVKRFVTITCKIIAFFRSCNRSDNIFSCLDKYRGE